MELLKMFVAAVTANIITVLFDHWLTNKKPRNVKGKHAKRG